MGIVKVTQPLCYSGMVTYQSRLASFKTWYKSTILKPEDLALCGFFYQGDRDRVNCFYCGVGLCEWEPKDNPWIEHALHSPKCVFLQLHKTRFAGITFDQSIFSIIMVIKL